MDLGLSGNGAEPPGEPRRPVEGLRLRALPSCGEPEFPVVHPYFEIVYGPMIGPAALAVSRNLARHLAAAGGPVTVCPIQVSLEVGLRASHDEPLGKRSHLVRALERLAHHRLVRQIDGDVLGVVVAVPPLPDRWLPNLPQVARCTHDRFVEDQLKTAGRGRSGSAPGSL